MNIILNDIPTKLPDNVKSVADLVVWKQLNPQGTAVAVNNKLVRQDSWKISMLSDLDQVTIISAAYGG